MAHENKEQRSMMEKLRHTYRLVVMNNETFEEIGSYRWSLLSLYLLIAATVTLVAFAVIAAIAFTPLRTLIPGYGDIRQHKEIYTLYQQIDSMGKQLSVQRNYTENFRKVLVGDVQTEENVERAVENAPDTITDVPRIEEDEQLRKEIEMDKAQQDDGLMAKGVATNSISLDKLAFIPPVNGIISEGYMPDKKHYGVDVMAPKNTPIKAIMGGTVIMANWTEETGHTIAIQHHNNLISFYKHNSANLKKIGTMVEAGEAVAIIGNTGTLSNGPHLHFELWHNGKTMDPAKYVQF